MITPEKIILVITFFIPFLFSLCFHEFAHGWVARKLGDNTAYVMGRLTLNPLAHIDWIGTVFLPIMGVLTGLPLFGWAKPVPVNERNLNNPRKDVFWVALAGPMSNIFLFLCGLIALLVILKLEERGMMIRSGQMNNMLFMFLSLNLMLAFFNLLPIHPLDGGKIIGRFLPRKWDMWLESKQPQSMMLLVLLVIFGGFRFLALPVYWILDQSINFIGHL